MGNNAASREENDGHYFRMLRAQADWQEAQAERAVIEAPARADEMAAATARVLVLDQRAYKLARDVYGKTANASVRPGTDN